MVDGLRRYQGMSPESISSPRDRRGFLLSSVAQPARSGSKARSLMNAPAGRAYPSFSAMENRPQHWRIRESALAATAFIPGSRDRYEGWKNAAVPPVRLPSYLRELRALYNRFGYKGASTVTSETAACTPASILIWILRKGSRTFAIF